MIRPMPNLTPTPLHRVERGANLEHSAHRFPRSNWSGGQGVEVNNAQRVR
jgi:hypothetical protein